jgi:hypothetical protein
LEQQLTRAVEEAARRGPRDAWRLVALVLLFVAALLTYL